MGSKHLGPDWGIVEVIQRTSGIDTFIETGTWKGGSSVDAAGRFPHVITIEGMPDRFWKTWHNTLKHHDNVMALLGESATLLPNILKVMQVPAIFWLDAHYCTTNREEKSQGLAVCPVMHELLAINKHPCAHLHAIMVDDARMFKDHDGKPREPGWPREEVLLSELRKHNRRVFQHEDVWYALPPGLDVKV